MDFLKYIATGSVISYVFFLIVAIAVILAIYAFDNWNNGMLPQLSNNLAVYGYEDNNGPAIWHLRFPDATGPEQSPINLLDRCSAIINSISQPLLEFSCEIHVPPNELKIYNTGYTVALYANWANQKRPFLSGGPLKEKYNFFNVRFRWGPNDSEGSEHMINSIQYAMELQAAFISEGSKTVDISQAAREGSLLMLSYLFMVTPKDNPYLEVIVTSLEYIKFPLACLCIDPMSLSSIMPDFSREYYSYLGSLTFPPCTEGVKWIVKPEPLMISSRQVRKFRKLCGYFGRMASNCRPVQKIKGRDIFYFD